MSISVLYTDNKFSQLHCYSCHDVKADYAIVAEINQGNVTSRNSIHICHDCALELLSQTASIVCLESRGRVVP